MPGSRGRHRRRRCSRTRIATTTGVLAVALGTGVAPALAAGNAAGATSAEAASPDTAGAPVRLKLPDPTGPYQVGTVDLHLRDTSRTDPWVPGHQPRELMVSLWYPATGTARHALAPWMQSVAAAHYLAGQKIPPGAVSLPTTAGHTGAPVDRRAGALPVLLYSTGLHSDRAMGTALVEDLASRGYLVVAIDHTHDANEVQFPGGRLTTDTMPAGAHSSDTVAVRAADTHFVIDQLDAIAHGGDPDVEHAPLPKGLAAGIDMSRIGMFGWSLGGATVPAAMHEDARIGAGADLDGTFYGPAAGQSLNRPFLLFSSQDHNRNDDSSWASFWAHLHGPRYDLKLLGSRHPSFSDNEALLPEESGVLGLTAAQLKQTLGTIAPDRAIEVERAYLAAFFDQALRHRHSSLLDGPSTRYPEVTFVR